MIKNITTSIIIIRNFERSNGARNEPRIVARILVTIFATKESHLKLISTFEQSCLDGAKIKFFDTPASNKFRNTISIVITESRFNWKFQSNGEREGGIE